MPAWTRKSVQKKTITLVGTAGASTYTNSDPAGWTEAAAADRQMGFLNVEKLDTSSTLYVYRAHGARADLMRDIDAAGAACVTVTQPGVYEIPWPEGLGASSKTRVEFKSSTTVTQECIFELDDVYRTLG